VLDEAGLLRLALTLGACLAAFALVRRLPVRAEDAEHPHAGHFPRQLTMVLGGIAAIVAVILALPVAPELRGQLLSLFGLAITALLTLSGTTFFSNAMAGLMLRTLGNFHAGDFIRVAEHFGRVSERGLLHTEIQTEDRDLLTLPNLYLINQPVRVVHASGTLVSCTLSLGYDVPRARISECLKAAAGNAGLTDPFVHVTDLGDFAVTYRVSGFLEQVRTLVSARSRLAEAVLDTLHDAGVEIVSPSFMNQRVLAPDQLVLPATDASLAPQPAVDDAAERIMFDKAETAARIAELTADRRRLASELEALEKGEGGAEAMDDRRRRLELGLRQRQLEALDGLLAEAAGEDGED
jgi:small-conductance mechanosensitive channel